MNGVPVPTLRDYYLNLDRTTPAPDYNLGVLVVN